MVLQPIHTLITDLLAQASFIVRDVPSLEVVALVARLVNVQQVVSERRIAAD